MSESASRAFPDPILLFGMPRSGTTWIGKLFDSHPHVLYRHEPDTWRPLAMPRDPDIDRAPEYEQQIRRYVEALPQIRALRVAGKRPFFPKSYMSAPRAAMFSASAEVARVAGRIHPEWPVLFHVDGRADKQRRVVWKSIQSLGRLGVHLAALPQARSIQIVRHPCGYIASVLRGLSSSSFSHANSNSEDYGIFHATIGTPLGDGYGLTLEYLQSLTPEERMAWRWVLFNEKASRDASFSDRNRVTYYEDVCRDPQRLVREMFEFCGLDMDEQSREFIAASTGASKSGYYSVYKDPEVSAWRWRDELESRTIDSILAIAERSDIGAHYLSMNPPKGAGAE